jgi:glutaredoxin 3
MAKIEIYTSPHCGYCARAKQLLKRKGVEFTEFEVSMDDALREAMTKRTGGRTSVPQIFIDGKYIGGSDDLHALDSQGGLDSLLQVG